MEKKMLFVFNPYAGKAKIKPKLSDIIDEFVKAGYWVTAYSTQAVADAKRVVKEYAEQYDMVVCSGGDGTLNEVVNGLLESGVHIPIGYIPTGSTNDYGRSLGISKNMVEAARVAVGGTVFESDLGMMNGKSFVYVAAFGAFTAVSYQTSQHTKNILGHMAYLLSGVKSVTSIKSYYMKINVDGEELDGRFIYGMVANTVSVGGFKNLTGKEVVLDDGVFEAVFIRKPSGPIELQEILSALLLDGFTSKCVCRYKASKVKIQSEDEVAWTLDGEYGGDHKDVEINNLMRAFKIKIDEDKMKLSSEQLFLEEEEPEDDRDDE